MTSLFLRGLMLAATMLLIAAAPAALAAKNGTGGAVPTSAPATKKDRVHAAAVPGPVARVDSRGFAHPPASAPRAIKAAIWAANGIKGKPYIWGGGHGSWKARGYDCSGTVSYVLHRAGVLNTPLVSGALARFGAKGKGRWITVYANGNHTFMYLAGVRFEANGSGRGPRWQPGPRYSMSGYAIRHPRGL